MAEAMTRAEAEAAVDALTAIVEERWLVAERERDEARGILRDLRRETRAGHLNAHREDFDERCPLCLAEAEADTVLREWAVPSQSGDGS